MLILPFPCGSDPMAISEGSEGGLYAASMEVRHDCTVGNLSRKVPAVRIFHWCMNARDVFQASGPDDQLDAFRETVVSSFGGKQVYATGDGVILVTEAHMCSTVKSRTVTSIISSVGVWDIPPVVYREGWESWRVIAWSERSLREMFREIRKIGELRIVSMRPIENIEMEKMMLMPASDIFAGLTSKQSTAVLLGLRHGYYSLPSGTDIQRLADGVGLSPSTFSEHLRKAEARILQNLRPYLEAYALRAPGDLAVAEVRGAPTRGRANERVAAASS
jgi:predicted DNA binding protein